MAEQVASLYADIGAKTDNFQKGAASVLGGLGQMAIKFAGTAAVVDGFSKAIKYSIDQAAEAEKVDAQLNAVLESTHQAAGLNAVELDNMAKALQKTTTYDDEAVKSSESLLLTFTKIGKDIFPQAEQAALDMSTALGTDLKSSTLQLGKALQDPITGLTALRRAGVSFTQDQKDMIKTLVDSGDTMQAQKIILDELNKEFGGSAAAAVNTYEGQMKQLQNAVSDLGESFGKDLLPELTQTVTEIKDGVVWINDNYEAIKKWGGAIAWVLTPGKELGKVVSDLSSKSNEYGRVLQNANPQLERQLYLAHDYKAMEAYASQIERGSAATQYWAHYLQTATSAQENYTGAVEDTTQAEEEAARAQSDRLSGIIGTINDMQSAEDNYTERSKDLADQRAEAEQKVQDLKAQGYHDGMQQYDDAVAKVNDLKQAESDLTAEYDRQALQFVSDILAQNLARDGWTQSEFNAFADQQEAWGLWSADVVEKAKAAWQEADKITDSINGIPSNKDVNINIHTSGDLYNQYEDSTRIVGSGNKRASGGSVLGGQSYLVGERGMEIFTPSTNGYITPNNNIGGVSKSDLSAIVAAIPQIDYRTLARIIREEIQVHL